MRELGVPKGVYTSTLAVNSDTHGHVVDETYRFTGKHLSVYDETKAEAHHLAERFIADGLPLVIVQPGVIYGPGDTSSIRSTFRQYLQRKFPVIPKKTSFCWGYIDDVARGHLLAMEKGAIGRNYFLAGPVHTMIEALELAESITGIPASKIRVNLGAVRALATALSKIERVLPASAQAAVENIRVAGGATYLGTNARAVRELGWRVRPLADGLRETLRAEMIDLGMRPNF
jgi:nucleoside-diphosphate-sugar epimerase